MIDTGKLDTAICDCLTEIGEAGAGYVVLVHSGTTLAVGTNIERKDIAARLLAKALGVVSDQAMEDCKGNA